MPVLTDRLDGFFGRLRATGAKFSEAVAIGILVATIEATEVLPVTTAIKTLSKEDLSCEATGNGLLEETNALKTGGRDRAATAIAGMSLRKKKHDVSKCYRNPLNTKTGSLYRKVQYPEALTIKGRQHGTVRSESTRKRSF